MKKRGGEEIEHFSLPPNSFTMHEACANPPTIPHPTWSKEEKEVAKKQSLAAKISFWISRAQLPFKLDKITQGDGNCFYRGIWSQCQRSQVSGTVSQLHGHIKDHQELRTKVSTFMTKSTMQLVEKFKKKYNEVLQPVTGETWIDYWEKMSQSGEWAESLSIQGTAWFLNHNILIICSKATVENPFITFNGNWIESSSTCIPLLLGYVENRHYQSLLTLKEEICKPDDNEDEFDKTWESEMFQNLSIQDTDETVKWVYEI